MSTKPIPPWFKQPVPLVSVDSRSAHLIGGPKDRTRDRPRDRDSDRQDEQPRSQSSHHAKDGSEPEDHPSIVIIGAGLAGSTTARALAERGCHVTVVESGIAPALKASGHSAALLRPHITRASQSSTEFFCAGFLTTRTRIENLLQTDSIAHDLNGVLQLLDSAKSYVPHPIYEAVDAERASELAGIALKTSALFFNQAGWVNPREYCIALLNHAFIKTLYQTTILQLSREKEQWVLQAQTTLDNSKTNTLMMADAVVLATGVSTTTFDFTASLPITPARGQISFAELPATMTPNIPISGKAYIIPIAQSCHIGATFDREDDQSDLRDLDHLRNSERVTELLREDRITSNRVNILGGWASVRATTPDRLPLVGPVADVHRYENLYADLHHGRREQSFGDAEYYPGLYINAGHGSRGMCTTSLCADLLANSIVSNTTQNTVASPHIEHSDWQQLVHPARFLIRKLKKKPN